MTGGVVCYIERSHSGNVLTRVRLTAIGLSRSWTVPEPGGESADAGGSPALVAVKSAARWVAETLQGVGLKRIACVCVDADGSICAWLSAPSADRSVIEATISQAGIEGDQHAGLGAGRLLAMAAAGAGLGPGTDTSVQALATRVEGAPSANGTSKGLLKKSGNPGAEAPSLVRNRYAVLAVPDAPVRVFLDELDSRGIEVQSVRTLWHAMCAAWTEAEGESGGAGVVESQSPTTGVVMIEPARGGLGGRLIWSWGRAGELLAGGTMRLKVVAQRRAAEAPAETPTRDGAELAPVIAGDGSDAEPESEDSGSVEVSTADAGRLAVDWLAWSAQLGQCPRRIVLLASPEATDQEGGGPASLGRHLGKAWPGATIDAAVYDDPTAATLGRLAGVRQAHEAPARATPNDDAAEQNRAALVGLSGRAGRVDKTMFRWAAVSLLGAALLIGVLGWRLRAAGDELATQEAVAAKSTAELLSTTEGQVPGVSKFPPKQQLEALEGRRNELREQAKKLRPGKPVFEETVRVLDALSGQDTIAFSTFEIGQANGSVTLEIPESPTASEVGPRVLDRILATKGKLLWTGLATPYSTQPGKLRRYLLNGPWSTEDAQAGGAR